MTRPTLRTLAAELGLSPRPLRQSLTDAIAWFQREGLLQEGTTLPAEAPAGE